MSHDMPGHLGLVGITMRLVAALALVALGVYVFAEAADWFVISIVAFAAAGYLVLTAAIAYEPLAT